MRVKLSRKLFFNKFLHKTPRTARLDIAALPPRPRQPQNFGSQTTTEFAPTWLTSRRNQYLKSWTELYLSRRLREKKSNKISSRRGNFKIKPKIGLAGKGKWQKFLIGYRAKRNFSAVLSKRVYLEQFRARRRERFFSRRQTVKPDPVIQNKGPTTHRSIPNFFRAVSVEKQKHYQYKHHLKSYRHLLEFFLHRRFRVSLAKRQRHRWQFRVKRRRRWDRYYDWSGRILHWRSPKAAIHFNRRRFRLLKKRHFNLVVYLKRSKLQKYRRHRRLHQRVKRIFRLVLRKQILRIFFKKGSFKKDQIQSLKPAELSKEYQAKHQQTLNKLAYWRASAHPQQTHKMAKWGRFHRKNLRKVLYKLVFHRLASNQILIKYNVQAGNCTEKTNFSSQQVKIFSNNGRSFKANCRFNQKTSLKPDQIIQFSQKHLQKISLGDASNTSVAFLYNKKQSIRPISKHSLFVCRSNQGRLAVFSTNLNKQTNLLRVTNWKNVYRPLFSFQFFRGYPAAVQHHSTFLKHPPYRSIFWIKRLLLVRRNRIARFNVFLRGLDPIPARQFLALRPSLFKALPAAINSTIGSTFHAKFGAVNSSTVTDADVRRYLRRIWRLSLRIKFERFFFTQLQKPVYFWFHSLWGLFMKRRYYWRRYEAGAILRATQKRYRSAIIFRETTARIFLRTLGFLFVLSGGLHCFVQVICLLLKKFRKHWKFMRFVGGCLQSGRLAFKTLRGCRISLSGKFGGALRAHKQTLQIGKRLKLFSLRRRTAYVCADSFTRWGIFGVRVWLQLHRRKLRRRAETRRNMRRRHSQRRRVSAYWRRWHQYWHKKWKIKRQSHTNPKIV